MVAPEASGACGSRRTLSKVRCVSRVRSSLRSCITMNTIICFLATARERAHAFSRVCRCRTRRRAHPAGCAAVSRRPAQWRGVELNAVPFYRYFFFVSLFGCVCCFCLCVCVCCFFLVWFVCLGAVSYTLLFLLLFC